MHTLKEATSVRAAVISILLLFSVPACRMQLHAQTTNGVIIVLTPPHYTLDAAGVNKAISDAETAGGGLVIVPTPIDFGSTTITVGSVCNIDCTTGAVELWFAGTGVWSTSATPGFVLNSRSKIIGISQRETELDETNSANDLITCAQNGSQTCEVGEIGNLRLEGGKRAIKFTGDTPGWRIHDIFMEKQTCSGGWAAQAEFDDYADTGTIQRVFFNTPATCEGLHIGPSSGSVPSGINNISIRDILCQNGIRCIHIEEGTPSSGVDNVTISNVQALNMVQEGIRIVALSAPGPITVINFDCHNCNTGAGNHSAIYASSIQDVSLIGGDDTSSGNTQYGVDFSNLSGGGLIENYNASKCSVGNTVTTIINSPCVITGTPNNSWPSTMAFATAYFQGSTSGVITAKAPAAAGTNTFTFPALTGTAAVNVQNAALQQQQVVADQGSACSNAELALSAGWQSTGSATVTSVAGNGQTCSWTITTGTTTAANPTVTDTLTNALPEATTVCEMNIHGGTHAPAAGEGFTQTALSSTAPVFTFIGTPAAGGSTYFVTRRCGP